MADASCSGSTPLKALAASSTRDRSLQQDRYIQGPPGASQFRTGGPSANGTAYSGFTDGPGLPQIPTMPSSVQDTARHSPVSLAATAHIGAPSVMSQFRANGSLAAAANMAGSAPAQSWVTDFASFNMHSGHGGPGVYGQAGPTNSHMARSVANQHERYEDAAVVGHPFSTPFAGPTIPYFPISHIPATHVQSARNTGHVVQTSSTAEAEFDSAMAQWMAINGHGEDVNGILENLAQELEAGQRAGLPELQPTRGVNAIAGTHSESTVVRGTAMDKAQDTDELVAQGRNLSVMEDGHALPKLEDLGLEESERNLASAGQHRDPNVRSDGGRDSEVSEAARQLLETVRHEDGEKWQNSRFLHLMREFRDGTKSIVDDEIHETVKDRIS